MKLTKEAKLSLIHYLSQEDAQIVNISVQNETRERAYCSWEHRPDFKEFESTGNQTITIDIFIKPKQNSNDRKRLNETQKTGRHRQAKRV